MGETVAAEGGEKLWLERISPEERRQLLQVSDWHGWTMILSNWLLIFAAMALVAWMPNPLTILASVWVIGSRQLGMAIVMHEAAHRTLFRKRRWNDLFGTWLAAAPVWLHVEGYRHYHMKHHAKTGTDEDPDLGLAAPFPITPASFRRKVWRDLSGQTGIKQAKLTLLRDLGYFDRSRDRELGMGRGDSRASAWHKLAPVAISNAVLLGLLAWAGHPALYLLWLGAWLTTYRLVTRIRSIAEHGMVPDRLHPLRNTRTVRASWWERFLLAPNRVNFHLEHHLMMTVPHHNLPRFHQLLQERNLLDPACVASGYAEVLRLATSR